MNETILEIMNIRFGPYICRDVVEFGDESMFNDVNSNFRDDDHKDIRQQHPHVVWGKMAQITYYGNINLIYIGKVF